MHSPILLEGNAKSEKKSEDAGDTSPHHLSLSVVSFIPTTMNILRFSFQLLILLVLVTLFFPQIGHLLVEILSTLLELFRSALSHADVANFRPL